MNNQISKNKNYFICTVQRSGKSWLCDLLTRLQYFGAPEEYLNYLSLPHDELVEGKSLRALYAENGFDGLREFVCHVNRVKTGHYEPVGLAIQSSQLKDLSIRTGLTITDVFKKLRKAFGDPTIFMLKRKDLAEQAVSHYFMAETGIAHAYQEKSENSETYQDIEYDQKKLLEWYDFTREGYELWDNIFKNNHISPMPIIYEDLKNNLYETVTGITCLINEQVPISPAQVISASVGGFRSLKISKKIMYVDKFKKFLSQECGVSVFE
jgi:LPS sulfotransferase NodH